MATKIHFSLRYKMFVVVTIMFLVIGVVSLIMSGIRFSETNEKLFKQESLDIANIVSTTVDADALKAVKDKIHEIFITIPEDDVVLSDDWGSDEFNAQLELFSPVMQMPDMKNRQ